MVAVRFKYTQQKSSAHGVSGKFCLNQEWLHLILYIVLYRKHFSTIGGIPNRNSRYPYETVCILSV